MVFILFDQSYCKFLQKYFKINRIIGILLTLCALVCGLVIGVVYLLPILINQLTKFDCDKSDNLQSSARFDYRFIHLSSLSKFRYSSDYSTVKSLLCDILQNILNSVTNSVGSVLSALFSTVLIIIMTPVFLIYFC